MTSPKTPSATDPTDEAPQPWWRFGMAWMAMGLPLVAVVAATLSAVIAVRGADPVVEEYRLKNEAHTAAEESAEKGPQADPHEPAEVARNHASMNR